MIEPVQKRADSFVSAPCDFLNLYPLTDAGIGACWRLSSADLESCSQGLGAGDPSLVLRLWALKPGGAALLLKRWPIERLRASSRVSGRASEGRCRACDTETLVKAAESGDQACSGSVTLVGELGLEGSEGAGWVSVLRSNRLPPTGEQGLDIQGLQKALEGWAWHRWASTRQNQQRSHAGVAGRRVLRHERSAVDASQAQGFGTLSRDSRSAGTAHLSSPPETLMGGPDSPIGASVVRLSAAVGQPAAGALPGADGSPKSSAPMTAPWPDAELRIGASLRVWGSGPAGAELELGGHRIKLGSGGRFSFETPIENLEQLHDLLRSLPRLPIASRPEDRDEER